MPSKTWYASKDARIAHRNSDGWEAGAGKDSYLPVGLWQGYVYRSLIDFSPNWDGVTKIVSAKLKLKTSGQHYVGFGSDPDIIVQRLTEGWSEGSSTSLSSSNAVTYANQPSATSTNEVTKDVTTSEGTWVEIDITDMIDDIAPTGVTRSDGTAGSGSGGMDGIRLRAVSEGSSGDTTEFYSRESGSDPRIVLSYISNTTPSAPQWVSPGSGAIVADTTPDLVFDGVDADGDNPASYEIQIDTTSGNGVEPDWASLTWASGAGQTSGIVGKRITRTSPTLNRGQWYAARARTTDPEGETGPWAIRYFKINSLPTATPSSPAANGLALIHNIGEAAEWTSGGSHAKPRLDWTYSDADGHGQIAYQLQLGTDGVNADIGDTGEVASSATFHDATNGVPNGTTRYWRVRVKDAAGEWSAYTSWTAFKVRWGQAIYEYAPSGGSNTAEWEFSSSAEVPANTQKAFAFRTATGASGAGAGSWVSDIGALTPNTYLNVLVRLATYGSGTNSTLPDMTFEYLGSGVLPDNWTVLGGHTIALDPSVRRYGTQSLRVTTNTNVLFLYPYWKTPGDDLPCLPNTEYTLSAWVKTDGVLPGDVTFRIDRGGSGEIYFGPTLAPDTAVTNDSSAHPEGWQRLYMTFTTLPGMTVIRPMIWYYGNGVGGGQFWVDAFQLEEGSVASAWSPGFVGSTTLDSGGVAVDGSLGGIFRLRGNAGGARDVIQLGDNGLIFGGDVEVYSDVIGELTVDGDLMVTGALAGLPKTTYTPTVSGGGTATFSYPAGWYVEIGPLVFLHVDINVTAVGSGASLVTFALPVAAAAGTNQTLHGWLTSMAGSENGPAVAQIGPGATAISAMFTAGGATISGADLSSTAGRIRFTGFYFKA